jgi:1,6-anhydro-N-acetylmuramate kinase
MAFGGQGAPLVPAFHQAVFFDPHWATVEQVYIGEYLNGQLVTHLYENK